MICLNYFYIILWACICQILASTSPTTGLEILDRQPKFSNEIVVTESQRLNTYMQIIKNIDIEKSMESIVELMNMLRLIFPIRFVRIKQKMYDMKDPITNRNFGVAFHALMNILRDKSKRDKLHTILQDLMLPHSLEEPNENKAMAPDMKFDVPLKYKSAPTHTYTSIHSAKAVETVLPNSAKAKSQNPESAVEIPVEQFEEPASDTPGIEVDPQIQIMKPNRSAGRPRQSSEFNPKPLEEPEKRPNQVPQTKILRQKTSENLTDLRRREAELKLTKMKSILDKLKNNSSAPATLQAKAAVLSQRLANKGVGASINNDGNLKILRTTSQKI